MFKMMSFLANRWFYTFGEAKPASVEAPKPDPTTWQYDKDHADMPWSHPKHRKSYRSFLPSL
jgi:hypothetical protein